MNINKNCIKILNVLVFIQFKPQDRHVSDQYEVCIPIQIITSSNHCLMKNAPSPRGG